MGALDGVYLLKYLVLLLLAAPLAAADYVVFTSAETPVERLTQFQLKQIYFGKLDRWKGMRLQPIQLARDSPVRSGFERKILGPTTDVEDYWLQQKLKGGAREPMTVSDWALVVVYVRRNPGFIGYAPAEESQALRDQGLRVIEITK